MKELDKILTSKLEEMNNLIESELIKTVRQILIDNPKKVDKFYIAMGTYFFQYKGETIHEWNKEELDKVKGYRAFESFINKWDNTFKITGNPMIITIAEIKRDW